MLSETKSCSSCKHPYIQHTGRSIRPVTMPRLKGTDLGPPELRLGQWCEYRIDSRHTCSCPRFVDYA